MICRTTKLGNRSYKIDSIWSRRIILKHCHKPSMKSMCSKTQFMTNIFWIRLRKRTRSKEISRVNWRRGSGTTKSTTSSFNNWIKKEMKESDMPRFSKIKSELTKMQWRRRRSWKKTKSWRSISSWNGSKNLQRWRPRRNKLKSTSKEGKMWNIISSTNKNFKAFCDFSFKK